MFFFVTFALIHGRHGPRASSSAITNFQTQIESRSKSSGPEAFERYRALQAVIPVDKHVVRQFFVALNVELCRQWSKTIGRDLVMNVSWTVQWAIA